MHPNYFQEFVDLLYKYNQNERHPNIIKFLVAHGDTIMKDYKNWKPKKVYKYMLTFTIDPKKVQGQNDTKVQDSIELYISKLLKDSKYEKVYYVKEHADSNCHWHAVIYSNNRFKQQDIAYYKKKYGNVDISRSHDISDEHTMKYLSKENPDKIIQLL